MAKIKILNDPIYGLISFPFEIIYDLIDHRYFQRLRRICQVGLTSLVYPGAVHTRFHHAIGATHLCDRLIQNLLQKGVIITKEEHEACLIATLLHDIGHGPFSHALEYKLLPVHHETLTNHIMHLLNTELNGRLTLAIEIFAKRYPKRFLSEIISSQLDVDRMDYLTRDSFYTGVAEGIIGYDRILKMMNVWDGQLVVEEKGIHSVEKFLISRQLMYHQVYLHKASIAAEQMLAAFIDRLHQRKNEMEESVLIRLMRTANQEVRSEKLDLFLRVDDYDVYQQLKANTTSKDQILHRLANGILNRNLFRTVMQKVPFTTSYRNGLLAKISQALQITPKESENILIFGREQVSLYTEDEEIYFLSKKNPRKVTLSQLSSLQYYAKELDFYYAVFPKEIQ